MQRDGVAKAMSFIRNWPVLLALLLIQPINALASDDKVTCPDGSMADKVESCLSRQQSLSSTTSEGIAPYLEYRKQVEAAQNISSLSEGTFGDSVSLYNGSTTFTVTDIDIRGNNELPVRLSRRHAVELQPQGALWPYDTRLKSMGNWEVDVPYMAATFDVANGWPTMRCSGGTAPSFTIGAFFRYEVWQGISIHVPGEGSRSLLGLQALTPKPSAGGPYYSTTSQRDMFDCLSSVSGLSGQGFRMTTTSGVKYYFDVATTRTASTLEKWVKVTAGELPTQFLMHRNRVYLLASKIEDRFGNTVQISYNASGHPTQIWSSDGRSITLTYSSGVLASATAHGRTWQYQYTGGNLMQVTNPDTSKWSYAYTGDLMPGAEPGVPAIPYCSGWPTLTYSPYTLTATHPAGAVGTFEFSNQRHGRSGVHAGECVQVGDPYNPEYDIVVPYFFDVMSLATKTITGPGQPAASVWSYDYGSSTLGWWGTWGAPWTYPCTTCADHKFVTVTQPDGTKERHKFGILYTVNDGRPLGVETLTPSNVVVKSQTSLYMADAAAPGQLFHGEFGSVIDMSDPSTARVRPVIKRTTTLQGRNFVWDVLNNCGPSSNKYCFDAYANPTTVVKSSSP